MGQGEVMTMISRLISLAPSSCTSSASDLERGGGGGREREGFDTGDTIYIPFVCCQMYARERLVEVGAPFS